MNPLARDSVALLDAARDGDEPEPADRARIRRRLVQAGVGVALCVGATTGTAAAGSAVAKALTSGAASAAAASAGAPTVGTAAGLSAGSMGLFAAKVVATIAIAGSIGAAGAKGLSVYEARHAAPAAMSVENAQTASALGAQRGTAAVPRQQPAEAQPIEEAPGAMVPPVTLGQTPKPLAAGYVRPSQATADATRLASAQRAAPPPSPSGSAASSTLEAETRLLREADVALRSGDPRRALSLLDDHAARFPGGVLDEERAAERVLALCGLGRTLEARADVERFLRDRPRSPLADRVRSSCMPR